MIVCKRIFPPFAPRHSRFPRDEGSLDLSLQKNACSLNLHLKRAAQPIKSPAGAMSLNLLHQPCGRQRLLDADFRQAFPVPAAQRRGLHFQRYYCRYIKVSNLYLTTF